MPSGFFEMSPDTDDLQRAAAVLEALVPEEQWAVYAPVLERARRLGLRFAIGGGLAYSLYADRRRNTKDLDVFILAEDHHPFLDLMAEEGFAEYTELPYDRSWSYRGRKQGYILDVLWRMLNNRATLDPDWMRRGWDLTVRGIPLRLIPVEELIWTKIYILYRQRCDWPDILSILHARGPRLDWEHLLTRLGEDGPLLTGVLALFRWVCPGRAAQLPDWLWKRLGLSVPPPDGPDIQPDRVATIRGGDWFPAPGKES